MKLQRGHRYNVKNEIFIGGISVAHILQFFSWDKLQCFD